MWPPPKLAGIRALHFQGYEPLRDALEI